jgi:DNA-directed RNA polymerase II subunit RPB2
LGCISDKQILNKIVYDPNDSEMCEALRPSLELAMTVMTEEDALDFIAGRGSGSNYSREKRI